MTRNCDTRYKYFETKPSEKNVQATDLHLLDGTDEDIRPLFDSCRVPERSIINLKSLISRATAGRNSLAENSQSKWQRKVLSITSNSIHHDMKSNLRDIFRERPTPALSFTSSIEDEPEMISVAESFSTKKTTNSWKNFPARKL
uniref:Uncharacterized protein n=1 Tax=Corethron hystrix TaxID=216773 RepID=A0A7S1BD03_9STRA|mmetsp:Transcript_20750/g.47102  ORF Transcript_20750/g.47102 Transcript_20750/m.47102 type:complete len:144 (+) Transcript_20750:65-496(+)